MPIPEPYYQDELTTIYHGDCAEIAPLLGKFDLLLTDPPYGIGKNLPAANKSSNNGPLRTNFADNLEWDKEAPTTKLLTLLRTCATHSIIFGGNYFELPPSSCWLVWDKDNGDLSFADCELAWTDLTKPVRKFTWRWNGMLQEDMKNKELRVHPTQKPLPLMHWCLTHVPDAKTVLDPFMGSGTTLLAAKQKGLRAVGIEMNERYCHDAADRLRQRTIFQELTTVSKGSPQE